MFQNTNYVKPGSNSFTVKKVTYFGWISVNHVWLSLLDSLPLVRWSWTLHRCSARAFNNENDLKKKCKTRGQKVQTTHPKPNMQTKSKPGMQGLTMHELTEALKSDAHKKKKSDFHAKYNPGRRQTYPGLLPSLEQLLMIRECTPPLVQISGWNTLICQSTRCFMGIDLDYRHIES